MKFHHTPANRLYKYTIDDYECELCYSPIDAEIWDQLRSNEWDITIVPSHENSFLSEVPYYRDKIIYRYDFKFHYIYNWCGVNVEIN